jgi:hypothetical protein
MAEDAADAYINWPQDTPMGDGTVNLWDLLLSSAPSANMPHVSDPPGHSLPNLFSVLLAAHSVPANVQRSQEAPGIVSGHPQRQSTTNRPPSEATTA